MPKTDPKSPSKSSSPSEASQKGSTSQGSRLQALAEPSRSSPPYVSPYAPIFTAAGQSQITPAVLQGSSRLSVPSTSQSRRSSPSTEGAPGPSSYSEITMSTSSNLTAADKAKLVKSLETHSVNTLIELRRIEKVLAGAADATGPMTNAWAHYVNSNNLLSELRGLTKNYPFSSECLDEAKWMVISDPQSSRSWNYCWLVLQKARNQNLIPKHARQLAAKPEMWGGKQPTAQNMEQLATACTNEWTRALNQMLRHWDSAPTLPGR